MALVVSNYRSRTQKAAQLASTPLQTPPNAQTRMRWARNWERGQNFARAHLYYCTLARCEISQLFPPPL